MKANRKYVIVDVERRKLFAQNQPGNFTTEPELASWWNDKQDAKKALRTKPALKSKIGQLKILEVPFNSKMSRIVWPNNSQKTSQETAQPDQQAAPQYPYRPVAPQYPLAMSTDDNPFSEPLSAEIPSREELFDLLERFCKFAITVDQLKSQLAKKVQEANDIDIDMLHYT